jgi:hypothetical protein
MDSQTSGPTKAKIVTAPKDAKNKSWNTCYSQVKVQLTPHNYRIVGIFWGGQNFRVLRTLHFFVEKNSWSCCMHTGMRAHFCQFRGLIISWFGFQPRKPRKFCPPNNTRYTVCTYHPAVASFMLHIFIEPWEIKTQNSSLLEHISNIFSSCSRCAWWAWAFIAQLAVCTSAVYIWSVCCPPVLPCHLLNGFRLCCLHCGSSGVSIILPCSAGADL